MKVPLSWLQSFVDVSDLSLDELVDAMSLHGLEVEEVHRPGAGTRGVVTKRVVHLEPHPDADKLQFVRVTDGETETELVCGAWNFSEGDVVAHAEVGATIPPPPGQAQPFELTRREIRGITSNGMLCSARELQLGEDHDGILVLPEDTPLGTDVTELLPIGEPVIEVAVLADRGDHHSVLGIAREVAAILGREVVVPDAPATALGGDGVPVTIDTDGCQHFVTRTVEHVEVGRSPLWLRQRLAQCGVRAINTVVDVTNLVMLELGQPLHAFDLDTLRGPALRVGRAEGGESLVTLDGQERTLVEGDLVISDAERLVSLAGVMGGQETEVGESTTRVLLEAAVWDPASIRRTTRRLNLTSEASLRFERRVDPAGAERAVARAAQLLSQVGPGRTTAASAAGEPGGRPDPVTIRAGRAPALLGVDELASDTQVDLLERLGCEVAVEGDELTVTPPTWRGDVDRPADVVEEVARLYGYERIPAVLPRMRTRGGRSRRQQAETELRRAALAAGLHEVRSRPFAPDDALLGVAPSEGRVTLENPLAKDTAVLAPTLVEGLLGAVRRNVGQGRPGVGLFEYARVFRPAGDAIEQALSAFGDDWRWTDPDGRPLPTQPRTLGVAVQGLKGSRAWLDTEATWGVYDVLAVLDEVVARLAPAGDEEWRLQRIPVSRARFHPGRSAELHLRGVAVGFVGQLHPTEAEQRDLTEPVVVGELLVEPLLAHLSDEPTPIQALSLATHPAMTIDVALVADESVTYETLADAVRVGAGELLDELWFFDEYRGEQVGAGRRSVAMRLRLQAHDRQLTDEDAEAVIAAVGREAELTGATLRR